MSVQSRTTAVQNEIVRLYCTFEEDGRLSYPAGQPLVEIIDTDGVTVIETVTAQMESIGTFYADWYVPANLPVGNYYDRWTFQWDATSSVIETILTFNVFSLESYINFVGQGVVHSISNKAIQLMKDLANDFIYEAQHTPIYYEQGMRVQQENQQKRVKKYYYFTLDSNHYSAQQDTVYFHNGQRFTVFETLIPEPRYSSSSSSSESIGNVSTSSSSSSSIDSSSSSSNSSSSESSQSSESVGNASSSTSSGISPTTTTTTTDWMPKTILTCVGTGQPLSSGTLTKISGSGSDTITFTSHEEKTSRFSTKYNLAYQNWNKDPRPIVFVNNTIRDDGWYSDYNGNIYFDGLMAPEDSINVRYNFRYFSDEELLSFLDLGLKMMNSVPPSSVIYSSLTTMPPEWDAPVLLYAAITALKRLIFGLNWQEKAIIFGKPDDFERAQRAIDNFKVLYTDYNTLWMEIKSDAKSKKLPGMAQFITPEYTLPGGRCMSADTYINCEIDNLKYVLNIGDLYKMSKEYSNKNINVLSMNHENNLEYVPIGKIWNSGKKTTYILKTKDSEIRLTKEHMVYIPQENKYKAVLEITSKDKIFVLKNGKLIKQKLLNNPEKYKVEEVYDIEVPSTENFIGNNVVSHNSRWFRYLFKTNA